LFYIASLSVRIVIYLVVPLIPLWLVRKVLRRYKTALGDVNFFAEEGLQV